MNKFKRLQHLEEVRRLAAGTIRQITLKYTITSNKSTIDDLE